VNPLLAIGIAISLLLVTAFVVASEFSVMSVRPSAMEALAEAGSRRARRVLAAQDRVSDLLACSQLGVTVASTGLGAVAEPALAGLVDGPLERLGLGGAAAHGVASLLALVIVVYLHVVLGELVPKNLAMAGPDRAALAFTPPLLALTRAVLPIIKALNWVANGLVRLAGVTPKPHVASAFTADEVASIVTASTGSGVLSDDEGLLAGALEFSERTAGELAVPLADVVTVPHDVTPEQLEHTVARTGYSRFPVLGPDGQLAGYLHIMDVLSAHGAERTAPVPAWRIRPLTAVDAADEVEDALSVMQRSGAHLVKIAAPAPPGVVFLEDILEELVGEVRDTMQRPRT
jgi:CBS domain containing-hemolysin-like protein